MYLRNQLNNSVHELYLLQWYLCFTLAVVVAMPTSLWPTYRMEVGVLVKAEWSRGEQETKPGIPLCSMPAPGPALIQHIMSKLLLAAAPIETLIKAIRGSSWGGAGG